MEEPKDRLRRARERHFKMQKDAIAAFGWTPSTYRAHENGQNGISTENAMIYGAAFHVSPAWILFGVGEDVQWPGVDDKIRNLPSEKQETAVTAIDLILQGLINRTPQP